MKLDERMEKLVVAALYEARPSGTGWWRAPCPFCMMKIGKADRSKAMSVLANKGIFRCWRCGSSGKVRNLPEAMLNAPGPVQDMMVAMEPPDGFYPLSEEPARSAMSAEPAREYLKSRGITDALCAQAGIGACLTGLYNGRVVVPVMADDAETWLGWVGRSWTKKSSRPYQYPPGMRRGEVLFNHAALLRETDEPIMVVEGVFDALWLWPDAVAVLGKPTEWQIEAMKYAKRPVAVVLDGDAHEEGEMLALKLKFMGQRAGSVKLPPTLDPDEIPAAEMRRQALECLG